MDKLIIQLLSQCFAINAILIEKNLTTIDYIELKRDKIFAMLVNFNDSMNKLLKNPSIEQKDKEEELRKLEEINALFEKECHLKKFADLNSILSSSISAK